jgi:hypothetical protein
MIINYNSYYKSLANQEVDFCSGDTQELYERNFIEKYSELEKYNWIKNKFTYKFNSHGFRCEEFTEDPSILFLGCSCTDGTGLPVENIWASIIAQSLGLKSFNLGQGGGSNDTAFRLGYHWIPKLQPKIVILLTPEEARFETVTPNQIYATHPSQFPKNKYNEIESYALQWWSDDTNSYLNKMKNISALELICHKLNIKFIVRSVRNTMYHHTIYQRDFARDLGHPGVETNKKLAEFILREHF